MSGNEAESKGELERLCERALEGDLEALETLMDRLRDPVYGLSLRMLFHPQDAEDAAQEIAIRILTHLSEFRGEGRFLNWAMRIAANYLINVCRRRRLERLTFKDVGEDLDSGWDQARPLRTTGAETRLLVEEVKIGCSMAILMCLDRGKRLAYILGEVLEVSSEEGAYILDISPAAFRKRLSRAREALTDFMSTKCGLVDAGNRCSCPARLPVAVAKRRLDPERLLFATHPRIASDSTARGSADAPEVDMAAVHRTIREVTTLEKVAAVYRSHPHYRGPDSFSKAVRALVKSGRFRSLT